MSRALHAEWTKLRTVASTGWLLLGAVVLLSLGVATAVRDSAAAIGVVLGLLYVFPILGQVAPAWQRHLQQLTGRTQR
jgi:ABC-2 type transport system permease protein